MQNCAKSIHTHTHIYAAIYTFQFFICNLSCHVYIEKLTIFIWVYSWCMGMVSSDKETSYLMNAVIWRDLLMIVHVLVTFRELEM